MEGLDMAVTPNPVRGVFIEVTTNALKKIVSGAVAAGLELDWCLEQLENIVNDFREETERETSAGGPSPRA